MDGFRFSCRVPSRDQQACDTEAREAFRSLVEGIRLTPRDGVLAIDVKGNLAGILATASPAKDRQQHVKLVAGARNRLGEIALWLAA
jgi:hypothetical protein